MKVSKAVILAAGMGTRFLPVTKGVPKEMLPIVDRPAIHCVAEECAASGITDILIIINRGKESVERYFCKEPPYAALRGHPLLSELDALLDKLSVTFAYQEVLNGTGGALLLARDFTGDEPFAVCFADDVIMNEKDPCTGQLIRAHDKTGKTILGVMERPPEDAVNYGVIERGRTEGRYTEVRSIVEKPPLDRLPSRLCSVGRYVLNPSVYEALERTRTVGGEIFLPYGIDLLISSEGAYAYEFEGRRYDLGSKMGFVEANAETGLARFGEDFRRILEELLRK